MDRTCPKCGLINPAASAMCDCGWSFATESQARPSTAAGIHVVPILLGGLFGAIVAVFGLTAIVSMIASAYGMAGPHGIPSENLICVIAGAATVGGLIGIAFALWLGVGRKG